MTAILQPTGALVTIVEEFRGVHGKTWIRALSAKGNRIVAPARLFTKQGDNQATINPLDLDPALVGGIEGLRRTFGK
jgi:hypothetical protein